MPQIQAPPLNTQSTSLACWLPARTPVLTFCTVWRIQLTTVSGLDRSHSPTRLSCFSPCLLPVCSPHSGQIGLVQCQWDFATVHCARTSLCQEYIGSYSSLSLDLGARLGHRFAFIYSCLRVQEWPNSFALMNTGRQWLLQWRPLLILHTG